MNDSIVFSTPRGQVIKVGNTTCKIEWNSDFGEKTSERFSRAQKFVDSEVLRLDAPYMPIRTGALIKSGELGTVVGSGEVNYVAPYAATQYYTTAPTRPYDPRRGGMWFERMKADHKDEIVRGAKKLAGGG